MIFHNVTQNTPEWDALRLGKFTASSFSDLIMKETTQGYKDALYKVAFERLTGEQTESFSNEYMRRGHELEPIAREAYELKTFDKVHNGGFFELNEWVGCSPDGILDKKGLEIKCPKFNTMITYLLDKELPKVYYWQVQGSLYVTGFETWDFMAYHPGLPELIITIERNESDIKLLDEKLQESITKVQQIMERIK